MKNKFILGMLGFLIIALIGIAVYFFLKPDNSSQNSNVTKIVDTIDGFDYNLDDRDTALFEKEFKNLKTILENEEIDYEKYAESISRLFIIDFYTLNNKINKYDVGASEYIHANVVDNFSLKAKDTLYKYIEDDSNHKRKQELPEVKTIVSLNIAEDTYKINNTDTPAYKISIEWDYVKNLDYDEKGELIFIKVDKKLVLVDYKAINE